MLTMQGTEGRRSFPRRDWDGGWSHLEVNSSSSYLFLFCWIVVQRGGNSESVLQVGCGKWWNSEQGGARMAIEIFDFSWFWSFFYQRAILVTGSAFHMKTCSFSREFTKCHHSFVQFCFRIHCDDDGWVLKVGDKTLREGFTGFHWCSLTKSKNLMSSFDLSSS